jgi:predicted ribosome quality control (RQC) complex YloA/Tae2 family protein
MRELYTLELVQLIKELRSIEGFYIDQFYELERNRFRFKLSKKGEKANLQCILPYAINRTEFIELKEQPTGFSIAVRKRVGGARIKGIEQLNNDRIVLLKLEKANAETNMIIEMFGRGNIIIADSEMKIQLAYQPHEFKDRSIRPNEIYKPPNNSSMSITEISHIESLHDENSASREATLINYMSKRMGIGKMYLKEAAERAGISPETKLKNVDSDKSEILIRNMKEVIDECTKSQEIFIYYKNESIVDFSICKISGYSSMEAKRMDSLENCLDFVYHNMEFGKEQKNEEAEKILASIEKQKLILEEIDNSIKENRNAGEYIMKHMHELNRIIGVVKSRKNIGAEELRHLSKEIEILNISMKTKSMKVRDKKSEE